jgi:hypothetical protein
MKPHTIKTLTALIAVACATAQLAADVVETKSGTRLTGKIKKFDGGVVVVDTDFAGEVKVKQSEVVSIVTDAPLNVRLEGGTVVQSPITKPAEGSALALAGTTNGVVLAGQDGTITSSIDKIVTTWAPGETDPAVAELQRRWIYELAVDITGKTGNSEQLGTAFGGRATLKAKGDVLQFYANYDRQKTDGTKSADQFRAGVDYQNNFTDLWSWYVRDEAGFDRVKAIDFSNVAAAGLGYNFIKKPKQTLTGRAGLAHRFESYETNPPEDVNSAGLDFGLLHTLELEKVSIVNRLTYTPTFDDFGNYKLFHESFANLPLAAANWSLRLGVSNDYSSQPPLGREKLDTTYFARMVFTFK